MRPTLLILALLTTLVGGIQAAIPNTLNYQGRLKDKATGVPVPDSTGNSVTFRICSDSTCTTVLWTEAWAGPQYVTTTSGLFNVVLGSINPLALLFDQPYFLEIQWYNPALPGYETMTPRQPLTSAPYAFRAKFADSAQITAPLSLTLNAAAPVAPIFGLNLGTGPGIFGRNSAAGSGVHGQSTNVNGVGVYAENTAPGGHAIYSAGKVYFEDSVGFNSQVLFVSQTSSVNGGSAIVASSPASATAAITGISYDTTVPGPATEPGIGIQGFGPVGVLGYSSLVSGIGVAGSVSGTGGSTAVFGINDNAGQGVLGESKWGTGVYGYGLTGTAGYVRVTGGVGVLASDGGLPASLALKVQGVANISGNRYPTVMGSSGQVLSTDGAGQLSWANGAASNVPAPLSLTASSAAQAVITGTNFNATSGGVAGQGSEYGVSGTATLGGSGIGVLGNSTSTNGAGVKGTNYSTTGNAFGVHGISNAGPSGVGVYGQANSGMGVQGTGVTGVAGIVSGTDKVGVVAKNFGGIAAIVEGTSVGLSATASGVNGIAIHAASPVSFTGTIYAFNADTSVPSQSNPAGRGVEAYGPIGVYGRSTINNGIGLFGSVPSGGSSGVGVLGINNNNGGAGVYGEGFTGTAGSSTVAGGTGVYAGQGSGSHALRAQGTSLFEGNVTVTGADASIGGGILRIYNSSGTGLALAARNIGTAILADSQSGAALRLSGTAVIDSATGTITAYSYVSFAAGTNLASGGLSGSGAVNQLAYFSGASTLGSSASLNWDAGNSRLGVGVFPGVGYRMSVEGGTAPAASMTANAFSVLQLRNYNVTPGISYGLNAVVDSGNGGRAVYGSATLGTSTTYGIYGDANNSSGRGVYGQGYIGVEGRSTAAAGSAGVWGAHQTLGAYGVYGQHDTSGGVAIQGNAPFGTGASVGVMGLSNGTAGTGVVGTGFHGVRGSSSSIGGAGLYGFSNVSGAYAALISHAAGTNATALSVTSQAVPGTAIYAGGEIALDADGITEWRGKPGAGLPPAGRGRIYFDSGLAKFRVSEGAAYVDLLGSGSVSAPLSLTLNSATSAPLFVNQQGSAAAVSITSAGVEGLVTRLTNGGGASAIRGESLVNPTGGTGVEGAGSRAGVFGSSPLGFGVEAQGVTGVAARGTTIGISATASNASGGIAGHFQAVTGIAVSGAALGISISSGTGGQGIYARGNAPNKAIIHAENDATPGMGIYGSTFGNGAPGVKGYNPSGGGVGVLGSAPFSGIGVVAEGSTFGLSATASGGGATAVYGRVTSTGPAAEFINSGGGTPLKVNSLNFPNNTGSSGQVLSTNGTNQMSWVNSPAPAAPLSLTLSSATSAPLYVSNGSGVAISATSGVNGGFALAGYNTAPTGAATALMGRSIASADGVGVLGSTTSSIPPVLSNGVGVFGFTERPGSYAVFGRNSAASGAAYGVWGETTSPSGGAGVRGDAMAASGSNYGVYGSSSSPAGYGVYGTNANGIGVYARSSANKALVAEGAAIGISATSSSGVGSAVYARGSMTSSNNYVVDVYDDGIGKGLNSVSQGGTGVRGVSAGNGAGVHGQVGGINAVGMLAENSGYPNALALHVSGRAQFNSGSVTFAAHVDFSGATVTGLPLASAPLSLTLNSSASAPLYVNQQGSFVGISAVAATGAAIHAHGGLYGVSSFGLTGVYGEGVNTGVYAYSSGGGDGLTAQSTGASGVGVNAINGSGTALKAQGGSIGISVTASSPTGTGLESRVNSSASAVFGVNDGSGSGIFGDNNSSGVGVFGVSNSGHGVQGMTSGPGSAGVFGSNGQVNGTGVIAEATNLGSKGLSSRGVWIGISSTATALSAKAYFGHVNSTSATAEFINDGSGAPLKLNSMRYPSTDGTNGQFLATSGTGQLYWANGGGAVPVPLNLTNSASAATTIFAENTAGGEAIRGRANIFQAGAVVGENSNSSGAGVAGVNTFVGAGGGVGVYAQSSSDFGQALNATYNPPGGTGSGSAVYASSTSSAGYAVKAESGYIGISATSSGPAGIAGHFQAVTAVVARGSSLGISVVAEVPGSMGIAAIASDGIAIYARNNGPGGFKSSILAEANNTNHAVRGRHIGGGGEGSLGGGIFGMGGTGVHGKGGTNIGDRGVFGEGVSGTGVVGQGVTGVAGTAFSADKLGVLAENSGGGLALKVLGQAEISGLRYPVIDGTAGQMLSTSGTGQLYWANAAGGVSAPLSLTLNSITDSPLSVSNASGAAVLAQGVTASVMVGYALGLSVTSSDAASTAIFAQGAGIGLQVTGQDEGAYVATFGTGRGLWAQSARGHGVFGEVTDLVGAIGTAGVRGDWAASNAGYGVWGNAGSGSLQSAGVLGTTDLAAVPAFPANSVGVIGVSGVSNGVGGAFKSTNGKGVYGEATGAGYGVHGEVSTPGNGSRGVYGVVDHASGVGVYGANSLGIAVVGQGGYIGLSATATAAAGKAIYASANSTSATAELMNNGTGPALKAVGTSMGISATASFGNAIWAGITTTGKSAILGQNTGTGGSTIGVEGIVVGGGANRFGVIGRTDTGFTYPTVPIGVAGFTSSGGGIGVYGHHDGANNSAFGIRGENNGASNTGFGVQGDNNSATGFGIKALNSRGGIALLAQGGSIGVSATASDSPGGIGVFGSVSATSGFGVWGRNTSNGGGIGVRGTADSTGTGVKGEVNAFTHAAGSRAVWGEATHIGNFGVDATNLIATVAGGGAALRVSGVVKIQGNMMTDTSAAAAVCTTSVVFNSSSGSITLVNGRTGPCTVYTVINNFVTAGSVVIVTTQNWPAPGPVSASIPSTNDRFAIHFASQAIPVNARFNFVIINQ